MLKALEYQSHLFAYFGDDQNGGFYKPADVEEVLTRPKELHDGAILSGNSIALINTLRLSRLTGDAEMGKRAHEIYRAFSAPTDAMPTAGIRNFCVGLTLPSGPASEVIIAGHENKEDTWLMLRGLRKSFLPNKIVVFRVREFNAAGYRDDRAVCAITFNTQWSGDRLRLLEFYLFAADE